MKQLYKAIFFDLDDTLLVREPNPVEAFIHYVQSLGFAISHTQTQTLQRWTHKYWAGDLRARQAKFESDEAYWLHYNEQLLLTLQIDQLSLAPQCLHWFRHEYQPQNSLIADFLPLLEQLKEAGYIVGVLSNRSTPFDAVLKEIGLNGRFDLVQAAGDVGYWKPDPRFFDHTLAQIEHIEASDCLYIGDNYYADGVGAITAGWHAMIFDPAQLYVNEPCTRISSMNELACLLTPQNVL